MPTGAAIAGIVHRGKEGTMKSRLAVGAVIAAIAAGSMGVAANAATGPPPPRTHGSATVKLFATGMPNPTSFAWGDGAMFAGSSGSSEKRPNGGLYVVRNGRARRLPGGPVFVAGLAWHEGALYLSGGYLVGHAPSWRIVRYEGFNGHRFTHHRVVYTAPAGFQGFDGLTFGAGGQLLVGVNTGLLNHNDHGPATLSPYLYDILSMNADGTDVAVYASGIRQPWQMAYSASAGGLFVSDLGQDGPKSVEKLGPPDFLLKVTQGQDYGFPTCNWTTGSPCSSSATPFKQFAPHTSIMGVAITHGRLYLGSFLGRSGHGGALLTMSLSGGPTRPVVTGFPAATDALAAHHGKLYVGGSTRSGAGVIYKVTP